MLHSATGRMGILMTVLLVHCTGVKYVEMTCGSTGYLNNYDKRQNFINKDDIFLSGQYSVHSNNHEDRRYKWDYCKPKDGKNPFESTRTLRDTQYDASFVRGCGGKSALVNVQSWHSNKREDRQFKFKCKTIKNDYRLANCEWTAWKNSYDKKVDYKCPNNGVIRTVESTHANSKEDRRWRFVCCRLAYNEYEYWPMKELDSGGYDNDYDGKFKVLPCTQIHVEGVLEFLESHQKTK